MFLGKRCGIPADAEPDAVPKRDKAGVAHQHVQPCGSDRKNHDRGRGIERQADQLEQERQRDQREQAREQCSTNRSPGEFP